ncbi:MAG: fumarate reductase subunit C [Armatimonadota bacterium]|nr:fumarate reductase subunit C [Armatimonadota bacterium]MDR7549923.1 fumarate reductase subunit C [Armatimonadota bacterium]
MIPYRRPVRFAWWWGRRAYTLFVVRELTSVFVGAYAVLLLLLVRRLGQGREAYDAYLHFLTTPQMTIFHLVALAGALYHSVTWFALAPKAMAVRVGERRIPEPVITAAAYAVWVVASVGVAWIVLRG